MSFKLIFVSILTHDPNLPNLPIFFFQFISQVHGSSLPARRQNGRFP